MKRVLTAVILIPIVIVVLFRAPLWLFTLLVLGVALLATHEYLSILRAMGFRPLGELAYIVVACLFLLLTLAFLSNSKFVTSLAFGAAVAGIALAVALLVCPLAFLTWGMTREPLRNALPDACVSYMVLHYIGLTLACLPLLRAVGDGGLFLFYVMLVVWAGDIAALYVGRAVGRHKLAPRVSPGKTWEGAIASGIGAILMALLLFRFVVPIYKFLIAIHLLQSTDTLFIKAVTARLIFAPAWLVVIFAICINIAAQLGDLVESSMKRGAELKDSGSLLPGHGGVLDRIDALLFAAPVALLFYALGDISNYLALQNY